MNIVLVSASSRAGSQSERICAHINQTFFGGNADTLTLHDDALPLWDGKSFDDPRVKETRERLQRADGFVLVIPEWNGMASVAIKNLFLWCSHREFAHKPALLVAVSSGTGGAFVISEMRSSSYKNSRIVYMPEHVILRGVEALWPAEHQAGQEEPSREERYLGGRLEYAVDMLTTYAEALVPVRERLVPKLQDFTNGMS